MTIYTAGNLKKVNKEDLIPIVINLQTEMEPSKHKLLGGLKALSSKFEEMESNVVILKNVNTLISSRLFDLEKQCWEYVQYHRRECLEVAEKVLRVKGSLSKMKSTKLDLPARSRIFVNQISCSFYRLL